MKKNRVSKFVILSLALITFLIGCSSVSPKNDTSRLEYTYTRLRIMDLDQMSEIMLNLAREFKKTNDAQFLRQGLLICLSRPDEDAVVDKIMSTVQTPLEDNDLWESSIEILINQSIAVIKDSTQSAVDQVTYSIVLENLISQMKPNFIKQYKSPGFESHMIEKIAAADIELSTPAKAERELNLMKGSFFASQVAQKLLDKRDEFLKEAKKTHKD